MPIHAACTACGHQYTLPDSLAGKTVKCKGCGGTFAVARGTAASGLVAGRPRAANQATPAAPLRAIAVPDSPRSPRQNADGAAPNRKLVWIVVGGSVAFALVFVVVLVLALTSSGERTPTDSPPPAVAQNPVPDEQPKFPGPIPGKGKPAPGNPGGQQPKVNPPPPKVNPPAPKIDPPPPKVDPPKPRPVPWRAKPDPGPELGPVPDKIGKPIPLTGTGPVTVLLPATPSPFALLRTSHKGQHVGGLVDLRGLKPLRIATIPNDLRDEALSPNGKFLLGRSHSALHVVGLSGELATEAIPLKELGSFRWADFLPEGHLVVATDQNDFQVRKVVTGEEVKRYKVEPRYDLLALSPGRNYVATFHRDEQKIAFRNSLTGEPAGEWRLPVPPGYGMSPVMAMAFSPDGEEFACLFGAQSVRDRGFQRLVTVKMSSGQVGVDHTFAKEAGDLVPHHRVYKGPVLEWIPDRSGWLLYGQVWLDYQTAAPVYQMTASDPAYLVKQPRRLVGKDHLATVGHFSVPRERVLHPQLELVTLPAKEITAAVEKARATSGASLAALPAPRPADLASARTLPAPAGDVPWQVEPDPAPAAKGPLAPQPIPMPIRSDDVLDVVFTRPDVGQAVVLHTFPVSALSSRRQVRADRVDLATGQGVGGTNLFAAEGLVRKQTPGVSPPLEATGSGPIQVAVSPDGARLLLRQKASPARIDLWDLEGQKHLAGWLPGGEGGSVDWFAFLDADRVLTAGGGKLTLWKVPECRALYVQQGVSGPPEVSPGRKYVAFPAATGLEVIEAATGERKGRLSFGGGSGQALTLHFSPDGRDLAAAAPQGKLFTGIHRWDLVKGKDTLSTSLRQGPLPLLFAGPNSVLYGLRLHDTKLGVIVEYSLSGQVPVADSPDGRMWFVRHVNPREGATAPTSALAAQLVPDVKAAPFLQQVAAGQVHPVLTAGAPLQLSVECSDPSKTPFLQQDCVKNLEGRQGFKAGPGGLSVRVTIKEKTPGGSVTYVVDEVGKRRTVSATIRILEVSLELVDTNGAVLHRGGTTVTPRRSLAFVNDDADTALRGALWSDLGAWARTFNLPRNLYRAGGRVIELPQQARLDAPR